MYTYIDIKMHINIYIYIYIEDYLLVPIKGARCNLFLENSCSVMNNSLMLYNLITPPSMCPFTTKALAPCTDLNYHLCAVHPPGFRYLFHHCDSGMRSLAMPDTHARLCCAMRSPMLRCASAQS